MAYADYTFYTDVYKGDMSAEEFERWAARAGLHIDRYTSGRAAGAPESMKRALSLCCCAVADQLRTWHDQDTRTQNGLVTAETVDGYSVSYRTNRAEQTDRATERWLELYSTCADFLTWPINLMYTGVG